MGEQGLAAELALELVSGTAAQRLVVLGDHDLGAFAREHAREAVTDAFTSPGDDRHPIRQTTHCPSLVMSLC